MYDVQAISQSFQLGTVHEVAEDMEQSPIRLLPMIIELQGHSQDLEYEALTICALADEFSSGAVDVSS